MDGTVQLNIENTNSDISSIIIEPWAEEYHIAHGDKLTLRWNNNYTDCRLLNIQMHEKSISIWFEGDGSVDVIIKDMVLNTASSTIKVPR